ncbi:coiled-coil and C2 domain-containing protein 1A-like [Brachyhypopomus gauderio]|uniref:coiled-coil and C2 domain-containing protein 1A-like n=1 Tax=Brachyhypopomus gauderio TaxID=698409 RepID=UPI004042EC72
MMATLSQKLDSTLEASKHSELEDVSSFLPPPESVLDEEQDGSLRSTDELRAVTKNSDADSFGTEPQVDVSTAPDQETSCNLDMEDVLPSQPLQSSSLCLDTSYQYTQLVERLLQQEEKCRQYCQQFSHMGNITETTRFERLAEECASQVEALKVAQDKGYPVPKFHMEDRNVNAFKINPELSGSEMLLKIVRGINLPVPGGISLNDLETSVRFEFAFPSLQESQRDQTHSVKSSSSPEFGEQFALQIKRGRRGFRRGILSKSIKFEIIQKGTLFRTDKVVGSAQLKLDCLESECDTRQLVEVFKRRTPTGGHLEVCMRIREPLGGPRSQTVTEKWLVLDPHTLPLVAAPKSQIRDRTEKRVSSRSAICSVL